MNDRVKRITDLILEVEKEIEYDEIAELSSDTTIGKTRHKKGKVLKAKKVSDTETLVYDPETKKSEVVKSKDFQKSVNTYSGKK